MKQRGLIWAASVVGAGLGVFWLFAIDAGRNYALWPPNPDKWYARRNVSLHTTRRFEQSGKRVRSGAERVDLRIGVLVYSSFPSSIKT